MLLVKREKWVLGFLRKFMVAVSGYQLFLSTVLHTASLILVINLCMSMNHLYMPTYTPVSPLITSHVKKMTNHLICFFRRWPVLREL